MHLEVKRLILTEECKRDLAQLRAKAFLPKFGERLKEDALAWNLHDEDSFHFGAYDANKLISTIRLTPVKSEKTFQLLMQMSIEHPFASLPCWVLSRAATDPDYRGYSVNMRLRREAFNFIVSKLRADSAERFVYGTTLRTANRLEFLSELGYELLDEPIEWKGYIDARSEEVVRFRIAIDKLSRAIEKLSTRP